MGLQAILDAIEEDAAREEAAIAARAEGERAAILDEADQRAAEIEERLASQRADEARRHARRVLGAAVTEAAHTLADTREEVFQGVVRRVREHLAAIRQEPDWPRQLAALLAEARAALPDADTVRVDPRDAALLDVADGLATVADLETWGGVVVEAPDGRLVDNTLETRLTTALPDLRRLALEAIPPLASGEPA